MQRKRLTYVLGLWLAMMVLSTANVAAAIEIAGDSLTQTVACGDQDVTIGGRSNSITLTGSCPRLDITGSGNVVTVEAVGRIEITGLSNNVGWASSLFGDEPRVALTGVGNRVFHIQAARATAPQPAPEPVAEPAPAPEQPGPVPNHLTGAAVDLLDSGQEMTLDCANGTFNVLGAGNVLTLLGTCEHLNVLGANNQVSVQRALAIDVPGSFSNVTWETGIDEGTPPTVAVTGTGASVTQAPPP